MLPGVTGEKLVASLAVPGATKLEAGGGGGLLIELPLVLLGEGVVVVGQVEAVEFEVLALLHQD